MAVTDLTFNIRLMDQTNHKYAENPTNYGFLYNNYIEVFYDDLFVPEFDIRYKGECIARPYLLHKHFILRPILKFSDHKRLSNGSATKGDFPWDIYFKTANDLKFIPEIAEATTPEQVRDKFLEIISISDYNTLPNDYQKYLRLYYSKNIDEVTLSQTDARYSKYNIPFSEYTFGMERFYIFEQNHNLYRQDYILHIQQFKIPRLFGQFVFNQKIKDNVELQNFYNDCYDNVKTDYQLLDNNFIISYELVCYNDFYTIPKGSVIQSNVIHIKLIKSPRFIYKIDDFSNTKIKFAQLSAEKNIVGFNLYYNNLFPGNRVELNDIGKFYNNKYSNHYLFKHFLGNQYFPTYLWRITDKLQQPGYSEASRIYNPPDEIPNFYFLTSKRKKITVTNKKEKPDNFVRSESIVDIENDFEIVNAGGGKTKDYWETYFDNNKQILLKRSFIDSYLKLDSMFINNNYIAGNLPIQNSFTFYEYFLDNNNYEIVNGTTFSDIKIQHQQNFDENELTINILRNQKNVTYTFTKLAHVLNQIQPFFTEEYRGSGNIITQPSEYGNIIYQQTLHDSNTAFSDILLNNRQQLFEIMYDGYGPDPAPNMSTEFVAPRWQYFSQLFGGKSQYDIFNDWISKPYLPKRVFTKSLWKQKEEQGVVTRKVIFDNNKLNTEITVRIDNSKDYVILVY